MAVNKLDNSMIDPNDIGTSANQLLKLDGSSKIPAVDGSLLTGIPSSFTIDPSNDPVISTNPPGGVGTIWINKTSGEAWCCTDETAGANVWTNVGGGTGDIPVPYVYQGTQYGYQLGGNGYHNVIQRFSLVSNTIGSEVGDIGWTECYSAAGLPNNPSKGYTMAGGGYPSGNSSNPWVWSTNILRFSFASGTEDTVDTNSDIPSAGHYLNVNGASDGINGFGHGGYSISGGDTPANRIICREIYKFSYASEANATVAGLQFGTYSRGYAGGFSTLTHGYSVGGVDIVGGANVTDMIQKFTMTSDNDATDIANLSDEVRNVAGASSTTHGYAFGGYDNSSFINLVDKFNFSTEANANDIGNLTVAGHQHASASSTTHGFNVGGARSSGPNSVIDKIAFASDGNLVDHGDLFRANYLGSALHF